ncbi:MAG: hypothetical protein Q4B81_00110 [Moraxella sp.]|nr:hypothetical protein [Moraxella sp.]
MKRFKTMATSWASDGVSHLNHLVDTHLSGLVSHVTQKGRNQISQPWFGGDAKQAYERYRSLYDLGAILQCEYAVHLYDRYDIAGRAGVNIPWFDGKFPLSWLATEVDVSLGSLETESYHAGAYQCAYVTGQSSGTIEVTFIETRQMDIGKSYQLCRKLATPKGGVVNEPKKYAFEIIISIFGKNARNYQKHDTQPIFEVRHIVCVKEASISVSSTGRSEIIKVNVTFEKLVPHEIFANSARWNTKG